MTELFEIPESKLPRLRWMERNHLTTYDHADDVPTDKRWMVKRGLRPIAFAATEDDAIIAAARMLQIKSWKEES